jgi:zinc/manganese transport system substrate-binding protein
MSISKNLLTALITFEISVGICSAGQKLNVVTTTEDLAAIAREVAGDRMNIDSIAKGYQDPHFVEAKPSFLLKLQKADLLVAVGLQLEIGWLPPLQTQSGNSKIQVGAPGFMEVSNYVEVMEVPTGPITRAGGDVHPGGNPHFWLDPENGRRVARALNTKFAEMQRADAPYFAEHLADFEKRLTEAEKGWDAKMAPFHGMKVVTYHRSFPNFAKRFQLNIVDYVEPKPGIPPTPSHTLELINEMKRDNIKLILVEPYFDMRTPNSIAQQTGGTAIVLLPSVGGVKEVQTYFQLFDYDINLLTSALAKYK